MADTPTDNGDSTEHESNVDADSVATTAASSTYKVLGKDALSTGAGVLGENTAGSGTPIGVQGAVPNNTTNGYGLHTPHNAKVGQVLKAGGVEVVGDLLTTSITSIPNDLVIETGTTATNDAQNLIQGHSSNTVTDGAVGATIGGGGKDDGTTNEANLVHDDYGVIAGGKDNQAGSNDSDSTTAQYATTGGGRGNTASGRDTTVSGGRGNTASVIEATVGGGNGNTASGSAAITGGGFGNTASNQYATVAGGTGNTASGSESTVAGGEKNTASGVGATVPGGVTGAAESANSFVWNDNTGYHTIPNSSADGLSSDTAVNGEPVTGGETFSVSAQGGVRFITGSSSVTYIAGGSAGWSTTSSRAAKTNIDPVDPQTVLARVEELDVATWEYTDDAGDGVGTTHIGPMAEEFHEIVDVGSSDDHINAINADGVLFAAVQGLSQKLEEKDNRIDDLEAENDRLRDRLATIEAHLGLGEADAAPADD